MDGNNGEGNQQSDRQSSDDENDVFEEAAKPALRRRPVQDGKKGNARRKPDRIKSWYIRGPTNFGAVPALEPSAIPVSRICNIEELATEANLPLTDPEIEKPELSFFRSVCASTDGNRIYFLLNNSSCLYRISDGRLSARVLRLSDQEGKRLKAKHVCVNEADKLIFVSGDLNLNGSSANVLARFRLPSDAEWLSGDKGADCVYLARTKLFENMEKFGSLDLHVIPPPKPPSSESETEQKENEIGEKMRHQREPGIWVTSPQMSQSDIEKTQIFKLTNDFKHKRCTVSLGRHGVCYLPYHLSVDEGGWVYVSVEKVESGPQGSTKLQSGRLLTFPSRPTEESVASSHTHKWMRVNSWHFEGLTPSCAVGLTPGERALVLDRERGSLHKVSWQCGGIEGHGEAGCFPVSLKPDIPDTLEIPLCFDGIGRLGIDRIFLYKNLEIFELLKKDLD